MRRGAGSSQASGRALALQAALVGCCALLAVVWAVQDWRYERDNLAVPGLSEREEFRAWLERRSAPFALGAALLLLTVNSGWYCARTARRLERERRRALLDPLTRLPNRRAFDRRLQRIADGRDGTASLLFIDLDYFKKLNDTLGHEAGDAALIGVAGAMRSAVSEQEGLCCRWGGDEFAILLPGADRAQAERVASRVARALDEVRVPTHRTRERTDVVAVRGSIGIATIGLPDRPARFPHRRLLRIADAALADAKRARVGASAGVVD